MTETTFYIFNEDGIFKAQQLEFFCVEFSKRTAFRFRVLEKKDIDLQSTIYKKFVTETLEYTLYDHGYVMKVEGYIKQAMKLLKEIDSILSSDILLFVSPSQRVENLIENKFPRGSAEKEIAEFLDGQFRNREYTLALANS
ncbi:MAG TPA: hypothetical protein VIM75_04820 [Ohtaekwangia sp.]|uniref:hypothetical protein n=1 Tax=Ohtaekwangia sp. TaxID=2066019 RepID=UPI002F93824D